MTATLPGRTHGLGLITEPLLLDLGIEAVAFANINFVATLIGALFCLPVGWWIDRHGVRNILAVVTLLLALSVIGMSACTSAAPLTVWLIGVRGFGQSALSLLSFTLISRWFSKRLEIAMGVFAVLLTFGFIITVLSLGWLVEQWEWRSAWRTMGYCLIGLAPFFWLLARDSSEGIRSDVISLTKKQPETPEQALTLVDAMRVPAFWVLVLGSAMFNLVWSGVTLFNESILREREMDANVAAEMMAILAGVGLLANMVGGAVVKRDRVTGLFGVGLLLMVAGLFLYPRIDSTTGVRFYALAIGSSGGLITVVFFSAWRQLFGRQEIGRIQAIAQGATVLASATGPVLMSKSYAIHHSYEPIFTILAVVTLVLAVAAFVVPTRFATPLSREAQSQ